VASYATFDDVNTRLGRFVGLFSVTGKHPDQTDIEALLDDAAADIDSAISARGFDPATISDEAKAGLVDLNAYGALARALPSANLGPQGAALLAVAQSVWDLAMGAKGSIAAGTFPVIALLEAEGGGPAAGDLWSDDPSYGSQAGLESENLQLRDTNLAPAFRRRQSL
jgi:hypothetical protein